MIKQMGKIDTKITCVKCEKLLDGFTSADGTEAGPTDGDFSICYYCGNVGMYSDNLTKLKPIPEDVLEKLKSSEPEVYIQLMTLSEQFKKTRV